MAPPRDAFAHFAAWKRDAVAAQHAPGSAARVDAELRRLWQSLSDHERRPWSDLADFERAQQLQEAATQRLEPPQRAPDSRDESNSKPPSKRARPAGVEPRQPDTPYICFWKSERPEVLAEYPNMAGPNVSREVGLRWKALSREERQLWIDLAAQDRERYEEEMIEFRKLTSTNTDASSRVLAEQPPGPRLPISAFRCFLASNRESLALLNMTAEAYRTEMRVLWKRMGDTDKQLWLDLAARDKDRYKADLAKLQPPAAAAHARTRLERLLRAAHEVKNGPLLPRTARELFLASKKRSASHDKSAWEAMVSADKLPFLVDEQLDLMRFVREMEAFISADGGVDEPFELTPEDLNTFNEIQRELEFSLNDTSASVVSDGSRPGRKAKVTSPKKPLTAFNMMYLTKREELMASYQLTQNECSALCGRLWREMNEADKLPFVHMAAHDKDRYRLESLATRTTKTRSSSAANKERNGLRVATGRARARPVTMAPSMGTKETPQSPGFRHYVECKQAEREQWTMDMWVKDWESLAAAHRVLWEELASDSSSRIGHRDFSQRGEPDQRDLDLLFGLSRNASLLS